MSEADKSVFYFDTSEGDKLVTGGRAIAIILAIIVFFTGYFMIAALILLALAVSLHYGPMANRKRPQLVLTDQGLVVDGLGRLPWRDVRDMERTDFHTRTIQLTELVLTTGRPLDEAVEPMRSMSFLRRLQTMIWAKRGDNQLRLKLNSLKGKPEEIEAALRAHLRQG